MSTKLKRYFGSPIRRWRPFAERRVAPPALRFEPRLQTEAVSALLGGVTRLRYQAEAESLYTGLLPEARGDAFAELDDRTFRAMGLHLIFENALRGVGPWPTLREVRVCAARAPEEEGADLGDPRAGVAILRVRPARLCGERKEVSAFLLNEFTHLRDLLDPAFGYRLDDTAPGGMAARVNAVMERYRALWNASVDGRIARRAGAPVDLREARRDEVRHAFVAIGEREADRLFEDAWAGRLFGHDSFLAAARQSPADGMRGLVPGGTCPLCGFVTWDVAAPADLARAAASIEADTPGWKPHDGACGRCVELYQTRMEGETWRSTEGIC